MSIANSTLCPACGGPNHCGLANATPGPCWCFTVAMAPGALDALPACERDQRCLCPRCATGAPPPATQPQAKTDAD